MDYILLTRHEQSNFLQITEWTANTTRGSLGCGCHLAIHGQMGQELFHFQPTHIGWMPFFIENDKIPDPVQVGFDGTLTVPANSHITGYRCEKWGLVWRHSYDSFRKVESWVHRTCLFC
jgi:hypothetical protein